MPAPPTEFQRAFERAKQKLSSLAMWFMFLLGLVWLFAVYYLPHRPPSAQEFANAANARTVVEVLFSIRLPESSPVRLEQHGGYNLDIWLQRADLETIPYPDRRAFVESVGKTWCGDNRLRGQLGALPSLRIRDLRSGDELGSFGCFWSSTSIH
jgi:hypothetical protein